MRNVVDITGDLSVLSTWRLLISKIEMLYLWLMSKFSFLHIQLQSYQHQRLFECVPGSWELVWFLYRGLMRERGEERTTVKCVKMVVTCLKNVSQPVTCYRPHTPPQSLSLTALSPPTPPTQLSDRLGLSINKCTQLLTRAGIVRTECGE